MFLCRQLGLVIQGFVVLNTANAGYYPAALAEPIEGPTVDWGAGNSGYCFQSVGVMEPGSSLAGRVEQSANGTDWANLAGATFTAVTASNHVEMIRITPTMRYVRWAADVVGDPAAAGVSAVFAR